MQSADPSYLARSKSSGPGRGPPPPVMPKPTGLVSALTESLSSSGSPTLSPSARSRAMAASTATTGSSSFGNIKRAFERQPPQQQQHQQDGLNRTESTGSAYSSRSVRGNGVNINITPDPRQEQHKPYLLAVPSQHNNNSSSRPRSVSTPAQGKGQEEDDDDSAEHHHHHRQREGESNGTRAHAHVREGSKNGIDNSQPDFSNLRARFQSQTTISNSQPKPDPSRLRPTRPLINTPRLSVPTPSGSGGPGIPVRQARLSVDSASSSAPNQRRRSPHRPSLSESSSPGHGQSLSSSPSRLSPNTMKQLPRIPADSRRGSAVSASARTPSPGRIPSRGVSPAPDAERNPFMGSDEDEHRAANTRMSLPPRRTSLNYHARPPQRNTMPAATGTTNGNSNGSSSSQVRPKPRLSTALSVRDSVYMGKAPPPAPQRAAPRPVSPVAPHAPKLPSRSNSTASSVEDTSETPEEKERKKRLNKRRRVVQELLETEVSYSQDLLLLQEVFATGMANSPLFTPADEKIIFMNLGEVIEISQDFAALLTPACGGGPDVPYDDSATFVGEAFLQMMSRIRRVYSEYCKRHEASGQHLQELESRKDLKPFFEACQETCQGRTKTWDLGSFLIKPVQRVLKYPLLINQIHALTPPEHLDSEAIATVQRDMLQVAEEINEIKRRKDIVEKIVGPKMKKDSDIVYVLFCRPWNGHGFNKKFSRTTQQLRQTIGGSDVTVDILFEAFLEKFNFQQVLARDFTRYIVSWLVSIKQYFDTQEALALTLREVYNMVPIHRYDENRSIAKVSEFHKSLSQFSKTVGRELELRLKKTVYKSIENFLKLFAGPLQVMKKREKKLLDYDSVRGMKERGETVDKNMQESADAYVAINEQLLDELPKFLGLTTKYFDLIVMEFSKIQTFFYRQVKGKILEFFAKHINSSAAIDVPGYMATVDVCEEYITAMTKEDGALARLDRVTLVRGTIAAHDQAFLNMRETAHRRKRAASMSLHSRSRNSSTASHSPMLSPISERGSWHTKSGSGSGSGSRSDLVASPTDGTLPSLQLRYFPGEDENPFEIPESIFQDGSVASSDDYEPFGNNRRYTLGGVSTRPLSSTSSYSHTSGGSGGGGGGGGDYQDYSTSKPPALDEGMDADEIGITQALFECTAIYPYSTSEDRQLTFEAGETIVVFGLNEDGWYFGKKVGRDQTGWFPASHCIQI